MDGAFRCIAASMLARGGALARGARVQLRLSRAGRIGRVLSYRMTATPGVPNVAFQCRPPGRRIRDC